MSIFKAHPFGDNFIAMPNSDFMRFELVHRTFSISYIQYLTYRLNLVIFKYFYGNADINTALSQLYLKKHAVRKELPSAADWMAEKTGLRPQSIPYAQTLDSTWVDDLANDGGLLRSDRDTYTATDVARALHLLFTLSVSKINVDRADLFLQADKEILSMPVINRVSKSHELNIVSNIVGDESVNVKYKEFIASAVKTTEETINQLKNGLTKEFFQPLPFSDSLIMHVVTSEKLMKALLQDKVLLMSKTVERRDMSVRKAVLGDKGMLANRISRAEMVTIMNDAMDYIARDMLSYTLDGLAQEAEVLSRKMTVLFDFMRHSFIKVSDLHLDVFQRDRIMQDVISYESALSKGEYTSFVSSEDVLFITNLINNIVNKGNIADQWSQFFTLVLKGLYEERERIIELQLEVRRELNKYSLELMKETYNFKPVDKTFIAIKTHTAEEIQQLRLGYRIQISENAITEDTESSMKHYFEHASDEIHVRYDALSSESYKYNFQAFTELDQLAVSKFTTLVIRNLVGSYRDFKLEMINKLTTNITAVLDSVYRSIVAQYDDITWSDTKPFDILKEIALLYQIYKINQNIGTITLKDINADELYLNVENLQLYKQYVLTQEFPFTIESPSILQTKREGDRLTALINILESTPKGAIDFKRFMEIRDPGTGMLVVKSPIDDMAERSHQSVTLPILFKDPFNLFYETNFIVANTGIASTMTEERIQLVHLSQTELAARLRLRNAFKLLILVMQNSKYLPHRFDTYHLFQLLYKWTIGRPLANPKLEFELKSMETYMDIRALKSIPKYVNYKAAFEDIITITMSLMFSEQFVITQRTLSNVFYPIVNAKMDDIKKQVLLSRGFAKFESEKENFQQEISEYEQISKTLIQGMNEFIAERPTVPLHINVGSVKEIDSSVSPQVESLRIP